MGIGGKRRETGWEEKEEALVVRSLSLFPIFHHSDGDLSDAERNPPLVHDENSDSLGSLVAPSRLRGPSIYHFHPTVAYCEERCTRPVVSSVSISDHIWRIGRARWRSRGVLVSFPVVGWSSLDIGS